MTHKVFGGMVYEGGKQVRCIVAAKSQKQVADLTKTSISTIRQFWSVTGNKIEVQTAMQSPETVFVASSSMGYDFKVREPKGQPL